MATRFYFNLAIDPTGVGNTPIQTASWNLPATLVAWSFLESKTAVSAASILNNSTTTTIPITTTQNIMVNAFLSTPLSLGGSISGTFSLVIRAFQNATTNNATLAVVVSVVSNDFSINRGTLYSNLNADTAFPLSASAATRSINAGTITPVTSFGGDRVMVEIGAHVAAPSASGSFNLRYGESAATDFALTSALTTDLNPWCEFSQDLLGSRLENYKSIRVGNGMSTGERIR